MVANFRLLSICFCYLRLRAEEDDRRWKPWLQGRIGWTRLQAVRNRSEELLSKPAEEQKKLGYFHTLREICRQPQTWRETCELVVNSASALKTFLRGVSSIILTGSGSSEYAGESVRATLQTELRCNCSVDRRRNATHGHGCCAREYAAADGFIGAVG